MSPKALAGIARRDGRRSNQFILLSRLKGEALSMIERHMYWNPQAYAEPRQSNGSDAKDFRTITPQYLGTVIAR
ncbi:hypothetical protein D3C78_1913840 [compost metagenome]